MGLHCTIYMNCGVPQGSILGPLLFIIYINDMPRCLKHSHPILFTDDTTVYLIGKNITELYEMMNNELETLNEWFKTNETPTNLGPSIRRKASLGMPLPGSQLSLLKLCHDPSNPL